MSDGPARASSSSSLAAFAWLSPEQDRWLYDYRVTVCALVASVVTQTLTYPADSVKTRMQVERFPNTWVCAKEVYLQEGFGGFYRGIALPMVTASAMRTTSFGIYNTVKHFLRDRQWFEKDTWRDTARLGAAGGSLAGFTSSLFSCPFELTKVRQQLDHDISKRLFPNSPFMPKNSFRTAQMVRRQFGTRGLYFGLPQHMTRDTIGSAFYFAWYDTTRWAVARKYPDKLPYGVPTVAAPFFCGLTAGVTSWTVSYPVDVVKSRLQRNALSGEHSRSAWRVFTDIARTAPRELYSGLPLSLARSGFSHGLTWVIVELGTKFIAERTKAGRTA